MVQKNSKIPFLLACAILSAVILSTLGLFFTNISLSYRSEEVSSSIAKKRGDIAELNKDKSVVITRILSTNTIPTTLNLRYLLAIFRDVAARANVRFTGFNINRDVISTSLIATEGNPNMHPDPASSIVTMMRAYMTKNGDGKFTLDPIKAISGDIKSRTTPITFRVLPNTIK